MRKEKKRGEKTYLFNENFDKIAFVAWNDPAENLARVAFKCRNFLLLRHLFELSARKADSVRVDTPFDNVQLLSHIDSSLLGIARDHDHVHASRPALLNSPFNFFSDRVSNSDETQKGQIAFHIAEIVLIAKILAHCGLIHLRSLLLVNFHGETQNSETFGGFGADCRVKLLTHVVVEELDNLAIAIVLGTPFDHPLRSSLRKDSVAGRLRIPFVNC